MKNNHYCNKTNGFVAILDIHFGKKCNIRLDNTEDVIEDKINQIISYCEDNNIKVVFIAGDVFDNCSIDRKTFMRAYNIFKKFKDKNIRVFTIYGNHDEYRYNKEFRNNTPLKDLKDLGVITILNDDYVTINDDENVEYRVYGFDYLSTQKLKTFSINNQERKNKYHVIIGHTFYDNEFMGGEENLSEQDVENINCDYLILGHDHSYYEPEKINGTYIFRFGSLIRGTSSNNDLNRKVKFMHFYGDGEFKEVALEIKDLKEVTTAKATIKEEKIDFNDIIEEIISLGDIDEKVDSIMESINNLENKKVKEIIRRNI